MENGVRQKVLSLLERTEYYDDEGEWCIAGFDWLLIGGVSLRAWAKVAEEVSGSAAGLIMVRAGRVAGEQFAGFLRKEGLGVEDLRYVLESFLTRSGWGRVGVKVDVVKRRAVVRIWNSVMARQVEASEPVCNFISGYIGGVLGVMFDKGVECKETKCSAMGGGFCEFQAYW